MGSLLGRLAVRIMKGTWGSILPSVLRSIAEGGWGEQARAAYWFMAGKKTVTGMVMLAVGTGLEAVCGSYADFPWACTVSKAIFDLGAVLAGLGLVDGGVRSPWPTGTPKMDAHA